MIHFASLIRLFRAFLAYYYKSSEKVFILSLYNIYLDAIIANIRQKRQRQTRYTSPWHLRPANLFEENLCA